MKSRTNHLAAVLCLGLAATGCVESDAPSSAPDVSPPPNSYPIAACGADDPRPDRPTAASIPDTFQSGDYIYRGPSETLLRFEDSSGSIFDVPFAWSPALIEGRSYNIERGDYGFTVSEDDKFVAFFGSTGAFPRAIETPFTIGNDITARLLLECDRVSPWDSACSDGYTEYLNLEIDGTGAYSQGIYYLPIDGEDYTLRVQNLMNWHPYVPGDTGCAPSGSHNYQFVLEVANVYPIAACSEDDPRPARPMGQPTSYGFTTGEYTLVAIAEDHLRFETEEGVPFDVPRPAVMPALTEGTAYSIDRSDLGYSIHEGEEFVAFVGITAHGINTRATFELGEGLTATLELDCDRVDEWYPGCPDGYTEHFSLNIDGHLYGIGDHTLEVDGAAYSLNVSALTYWNPAPPGASGCAPSPTSTFLFTLAPQGG